MLYSIGIHIKKSSFDHIFNFWIVSWRISIWNQLWNNNAYYLSYTANTMPADALVTLGASASAGMILNPKAGLFRH